MSLLSKRQKEIYDFIVQKLKADGFSPSYKEIAERFSVSSPATIHQHIKSIQKKGFLHSVAHHKRSLEPVVMSSYRDSLVLDLPLVGLIAAGSPIEALEEKETMAIPANLVTNPNDSYILKVKGQSMIEDGILDGDYVIVERNHYPANGDVVVALLDNAYATLKKFFRETNRIRLQPANSTLKPIYCTDPLIQGVVKAVIRKFN